MYTEYNSGRRIQIIYLVTSKSPAFNISHKDHKRNVHRVSKVKQASHHAEWPLHSI